VNRVGSVERTGTNLSRNDLDVSRDREIQQSDKDCQDRTAFSGEEKPLPFSFASPTASQKSLERESTAKTGKAPTLPEEDAPAVNAEGELAALPYETEFEIQEAVENFNAYLEILREWDAMEKLKQERLAEEEVRCD
jgi:hypothetical protein